MQGAELVEMTVGQAASPAAGARRLGKPSRPTRRRRTGGARPTIANKRRR